MIIQTRYLVPTRRVRDVDEVHCVTEGFSMAEQMSSCMSTILYIPRTEVFTGYNSTDTGFERTKAPYLQQTHSALEPYAASPDVPSGIAAGAP